MELLDEVNENNELTGNIIDREIVHKEGLLHREVGVIIINEENEILLEKRSPTKKQSPNKWALCAGHIEAGDVPENAIIREIKEEIGIDVAIEELECIEILRRNKKFIENNQYNNCFIYLWKYNTNIKAEEYIIQEEEVSEVKYFDIQEVANAVEHQNEQFAFSDEEYIKEILKNIKGVK